VLDDDVFVCRALKIQLEILGFKVLVFHSSEDFLSSEIACPASCLLIDVYLPGINGIELLQRLKAEGAVLPAILMSGRDDAKTRRMMRLAKPAAKLFKPFDTIALERALATALRAHRPKRCSS